MKTHDPRSCGYYTATHGPFTTAAAAHVHLVADHCARMRVLPHCGVRQHGCNKRAVTALLEIAHVLRWVFVPLVPHFAPVFFCQVHEARRQLLRPIEVPKERRSLRSEERRVGKDWT